LTSTTAASEPGQGLRIEAAVGMRHEGPGQSEHAGVSLERPVHQLRQLAIEAGREVGADLANLFLDDVKVVDQPLGRRGDGAFLTDRLADGAVGGEQHAPVVAQALRERPAGCRSFRHTLRRRQGLGMLLEALDAEQLRTDRLVRLAHVSCRQSDEIAEDRYRSVKSGQLDVPAQRRTAPDLPSYAARPGRRGEGAGGVGN
jgi:hypothetical protein